VLVVFDEAHFTLELGVEVILALGESVTLLFHGGAVASLFVTKAIVYNIVLSQAVVESALSVCRVVHEAQATRVVGDVGVTATSVVHVDNWLRVDVGQRLSWHFICRHKGTELFDRLWLTHGIETTIVTVDISISACALSSIELFFRGVK